MPNGKESVSIFLKKYREHAADHQWYTCRTIPRIKKPQNRFFIGCLYYDEEQVVDGYDYISIKGCKLNRNLVFNLKNRNGKEPCYAIVFIDELEPLFPGKVIQWTEKLSINLFNENIQLQFANVPNEDDTIKSYQENVSLSE